MGFPFPPEIAELVRAHMASGEYASEKDLVIDAMRALDELRTHHQQLRKEIRQRLEAGGTNASKPLDRDAFNAEARRRLDEAS